MIPPTLQANPILERWVSFPVTGRVRVAFGKVEYGQGAKTALAQIAADELDVAWERLDVVNQATSAVPDEGMTVGSMSIEMSGASVRAAAAEVRALFLAEAARRLRCEAHDLGIDDGAFTINGVPSGLDYWRLAGDVNLNRAPEGKARWKSADQHRIVGTSVARLDLPAKVFGGAFINDLPLEGVMHARVLRQPGFTATLASLDEAAVHKAAGGDVEILVDKAFVAFLSKSERAVSLALAAAEQKAKWNTPRAVHPELTEPSALRGLPNTPWEGGAPAPEPSNRRKVSARYGRPFISHGSIGPSCGVARFDGEKLAVWTHAQGVYPIRGILARLTGLAPDKIHVEHAQGAGNYGHNGSDDAAADAAAIAMRKPGENIRVQWRREDEFGFAPVGTAMHMEMSAELDESGRLVDFTNEIWSAPHVGRGHVLAETALNPGTPPPAMPMMAGFSGGRLNAVPSYDIAATRVKDNVIVPPVRTSSLRGLGGPVNEYAGECFIDECAEAAGADPLAYRLAMLSDPRGRVVLERLGTMCGWSTRGKGGDGTGLGLAYARHRDRGAYVAVAAAVTVDKEVRLTRMWAVADCGLVINPDGAKNQIEGGMIMCASWALKEQVKLGGQGIASTTWADYPILRFTEVPPIEIELIDAPDQPPFGTGEISGGPALAAIGNAVAHALGTRIRELPYTRERIAAALLSA
ncbi:MAG: xanthine dehydrogenase family protein molybdopterin-binding subunit [Alphaproteobacteria bacterium]|nr:xanthine dehydrogenase family protein molybdopterin-binding subunit [Alphaproteobacteria bacterium]